MKSQKGSAHIYVIVALVVALTGSLGYIFWQNLNNNSSSKTESSKDQKEETVLKPDVKADPRIETKQKISEWINLNSSTDLLAYMNPTLNYAIANSGGIFTDAPKQQVLNNVSSYLVGHVEQWTSQDYAETTNQPKFKAQAEQDTFFDFNDSYVSLNTTASTQDFAAFKVDAQGLITDIYVGTVLDY